MERYNVLDLNDGSTQVKELGPKVDVDQDVAEDENDPSTPDTLMSPEPNVVNPINVSPDWNGKENWIKLLFIFIQVQFYNDIWVQSNNSIFSSVMQSKSSKFLYLRYSTTCMHHFRLLLILYKDFPS